MHNEKHHTTHTGLPSPPVGWQYARLVQRNMVGTATISAHSWTPSGPGDQALAPVNEPSLDVCPVKNKLEGMYKYLKSMFFSLFFPFF